MAHNKIHFISPGCRPALPCRIMALNNSFHSISIYYTCYNSRSRTYIAPCICPSCPVRAMLNPSLIHRFRLAYRIGPTLRPIPGSAILALSYSTLPITGDDCCRFHYSIRWSSSLLPNRGILFPDPSILVTICDKSLQLQTHSICLWKYAIK